MLRFFSIIVPAHNEEHTIGPTLHALTHQHYPSNRYEIIVVENGSHDNTLAEAKQFESPQCRVYSLAQAGVSRARNAGLAHASATRDWSITCDADTLLKESFLEELNQFLEQHPGAAYGMAQLSPIPSTAQSRFWFAFRNWRDRLLKTLDTVHIVRRDVAEFASYPEDFHFTEDLQYTKMLRGHGAYFFMPTASVVSSTRRYEKQGYWYVFFKDLLIGLLYAIGPFLLRGKSWEAVRSN